MMPYYIALIAINSIIVYYQVQRRDQKPKAWQEVAALSTIDGRVCTVYRYPAPGIFLVPGTWHCFFTAVWARYSRSSIVVSCRAPVAQSYLRLSYIRVHIHVLTLLGLDYSIGTTLKATSVAVLPTFYVERVGQKVQVQYSSGASIVPIE